MWTQTWQWACREKHIARVGDNYVYDIGDYSVIVVRTEENTIKAYLNSCTHRDTRLLAANWKAAQEAFMEAYHNFHTHHSPNGANTQYDIFGKYLSRFIHNIGSYSPESLADYPGKKWREPTLTEVALLAQLAVKPRPLEAGETARGVAAQLMREQWERVWISTCPATAIA